MRIFILCALVISLCVGNSWFNQVNGRCYSESKTIIYTTDSGYGPELQAKAAEVPGYQCAPAFNWVAQFTNKKHETISYYSVTKAFFPLGAVAFLSNSEAPAYGPEFRYKPVPNRFVNQSVFNFFDVVLGTDSRKVVVNVPNLIINVAVLAGIGYWLGRKQSV